MKKNKLNFFCILITIILLLSLSACDVNGKNNNDNVEPSEYSVTNAYFTKATYEPKTYTTVNVKNGQLSSEYGFECTSSCSVSLFEYTAEMKLYSNTNALLNTETITKSTNIKANQDFSFDVKIPLQVQTNTSSIDIVFTGKSKDNPASTSQKFNDNQITHKTIEYKVTFVYNNGLSNKTVLVKEGETVSTPDDPQKTNYLFSGWYLEQSAINKYDFSKAVAKDFTLYAKYELDALTLTNKISTDYIKGVVKVYNKCYNTFLGIETSSSTSQGSGFCFHIQDGRYYILTNCHVAKFIDDYDKQEYTIEDYQGNTYKGYLYKNPSKSYSAISADYDLACLYFIPSSTNVKKMAIASINPNVGEDVISLGAPKGQTNAITYGQILKYCKLTLSDTSPAKSNVTFDVIYHNAYGNNGSSGGPLLDSNLNVIGINYAGSSSTGRVGAIPVKKLKEFLRDYVYN